MRHSLQNSNESSWSWCLAEHRSDAWNFHGNPGVAALVTSVAAILIDQNHVSLSEMNFSLEITMKKWSALLFDFFFGILPEEHANSMGLFCLDITSIFYMLKPHMLCGQGIPPNPPFSVRQKPDFVKAFGMFPFAFEIATRKHNACNKSLWGASKHLCLVYHAEQE